MKFPEKYIKRGEHNLHGGQKSDIFYDVEEMITDSVYLHHLLNKIPFSPHYVGIKTGGAYIAIAIHARHYRSKLSTIKKGKLIGEKPEGDWMLIDDVVTTGGSLLEALALFDRSPRDIVVAVDRREKNENPKVNHIFEI